MMLDRCAKTTSMLGVFVSSVALCALVSAFPQTAYATIEGDQTPATEEEINAALLSGEISTEQDDGAEAMTLSATPLSVESPVGIEQYAGADMFETAAAEALAAYPGGSDTAIIAGQGIAWMDALSSAGLAASRGPVLFTWRDSLPGATADALAALGVRSVVVVGGAAAVSDEVVSQLAERGIALEARLAGEDAIGTQLAIFEYGLDNGLWDPGLLVVATMTGFGDALSASPVAYAERAPIFLVGPGGGLTAEQRAALADAAGRGFASEVAVVGGEAVVSVRTEGFLSGLATVNKGTVVRLSGPTQYETSAEVARWAVSSHGFDWSAPAFSTGAAPYDALAGSVLQGASRSPLLLVDRSYLATVDIAQEHKAEISELRFFGGPSAVPNDVRRDIVSRIIGSVAYENTGIGLDEMADLELSAAPSSLGYTQEQILESMNPDNASPGDFDFYQFGVLDEGYSGVVTADMLNDFISTSGSDGMLAGMGQAFVDAANEHGINEVYLLSHAILESGWGKSQLARGWTFDEDILDEDGDVLYEATGKTYYNFYGIGAYDSSPLSGGRLLAYLNDWDSPEKAIDGAAKWIASNYLNNGWEQNTLYKMRWNYLRLR